MPSRPSACLFCFLVVQLEIMDENAYEREPGTSRVSQNYVKLALKSLMPVVLETLSKQDEDSADDLEHWDLGTSLTAGRGEEAQ